MVVNLEKFTSVINVKVRKDKNIKKKVYIETLGCSKNVTDTEYMLGIISDTNDFDLAESPEDADVLIVNTCSFIHDAQEESLEVISDFSQAGKKLIVTGCLSQAYPNDLAYEFPNVNAIVGTASFFRINEVLEALYENDENTESSDFVDETVFLIDHIDTDIPENLSRILTTPSHYAFLKIAEGCDNHCTYCLIPSLRGKFRSRFIEDIVSEAKDLAEMGVKELIIIAQDTSRYGIDIYGELSLAKLLKELAQIENIKWIRLHYLYPDVINRELIQTIKDNPKIIPYFDIPIQHGSNRVLKRMNRRTTREQIINVVQMIREILPKSVLRTTTIVGFPGETEDDFKELVELVKLIKFDRLGAFTYSDLPELPSSRLKGHLSEDIKIQRRDALMELQKQISYEIMQTKVDTYVEAVVEEFTEDGGYVARSKFDAPEVDGVVYIAKSNVKLDIGDFVIVKISETMEYDLVGEFYEFA